MPSPPPATTTTYTTIPISGTDVIFRSFQNLSSFLSLLRPWPEFIASFDRPDSLHHAATRLRLNSKYFSVNYALIVTACSAVSLIGDPRALLIFGSVLMLWLALYFFREDPMVVWGYHVHDHLVTVVLVLITGIAVWNLGFVGNLAIGMVAGVLVAGVHGVFRNPRGIYLDEVDAESEGLISPTSVSPSSRVYHLST
ncbi:PRA1 family protein G2-like [Bidens hawaiensis]|uniref:PRA1 family protein G2-like n=1 Tax=Bidens hawaiensis TaxID=980011 RepID=UPI00404B0A67